MTRWLRLGCALLLAGGVWACGGGESGESSGGAATGGATAPAEGSATAPAEGSATAPAEGSATAPAEGSATGPAAAPTTGGTTADPAVLPDSLPRGLLVACSQFRVENGAVSAAPGPARLDLITREGGAWRTETLEDPESNVFHKALVWEPPGGPPALLTLGGTAAAVKRWRHGPNGWTSDTLWTEAFGGRFNRMRDAEIGDLYGTGPVLAVGTHDQGVVAALRPAAANPDGSGAFEVVRLDREPNTFIHEIELGDLDGDGTLEVYATPSEPNDLDGGEQHGEVVRYVPRTGAGRVVVADLGNRHAKEILVEDVDGDGRDELYVAVEALTRGSGDALEIVEPVEIRRYDADTPPTARVVIATLRDRLTRFLTAGDVDGDGRRELVAAAFRTGLWLLRPGRDPRGEWSLDNIDRESSGFEHAALLTDLDGDHRDELYVAADDQGELRRYVWVAGRPRREVVRRLDVPRSVMTWNLVSFPVELAR